MSGGTSKLTSLLQYRFVRKDGQEQGSSQNGSQSSSDLETLSPSQTSTIPPGTPDKNPLNFHSTPDGKGISSSSLSSPDSPIFKTRPKLIDRQEKVPLEKSANSSPWLTKENGKGFNGVSTSKKRTLPAFPDDSDDDDVVMLDSLDQKIRDVRPLFPLLDESEVRKALIDGNGDVEAAINILIDIGRSKKQLKRIRMASQESTSPDVAKQPRKRIRQISSDSGDDTTQGASQSTVGYSLESQGSLGVNYIMAEGSKTTDDPPVVGNDEGIDPQTLEIARILRSLADEITEEKSMPLLKEIITKIAHESVHDRNYNVLTDMRRFVNVLGFSVQFSVSKTKEIIKILLVIWNQQNVARYVMKEVYNEDIGAAEKPIDPDKLDKIPNAVKQLDDKAIKIFFKALQDEEEEVKNIRLMVVGMFGVGKTSLVNNLIKDFRDKNIIPPSTEGIDLHRCQVMEDGDWCLDTKYKSQKYKNRMESAFKKIPLNTNSATASTDYTDSIEGLPVKEQIDADVPDKQIQTEPEQMNNIRNYTDQHEKDEFVQNCLTFVQKINDNKDEPLKDSNVPLQRKETEITVSEWDFAGQTLYYSTHQFFLNQRSIYLVLMDMTKGLHDKVKELDGSGIWCGLVDECTFLDIFKFWLNAIHMYSGYKSTTGEIKHTVILVGTRKDQMAGNDQDKENTKNRYFYEALLSFERNSPVLNHIYKKMFLVNNLSPTDPAFAELREEIKRLSENQDYWGKDKYPFRWIHMEQSLDKMRDEGQQLVHMDKIEEVNLSKQHQFRLSEDELLVFLEVQHRQGNILFFNTPELKRLVVLAPQWIIEAFKCFVTHIIRRKPKFLKDWEEYEKLAILKPQITCIDEIMNNSPHIKENKDDVIKYMEHLNVIAKPLTREDENNRATEQHKDGQDETYAFDDFNFKLLDFHIVPCRLKNAPPPIEQFTSPDCKRFKRTPVLGFVFCEKFMFPAFFHRLVAVCIRRWQIAQEGDEYRLYNGLAIFAIRSTYTLTIWYKDYIIYARIACCSKKLTSGINTNLCQEVRHTLWQSLQDFVGNSVETPRTATAFDVYIQCPAMEKSLHNKGMLRVAQFNYESELDCEGCEKRHAVERDEALQCWFKHELDLADKCDGDDLNILADDDLLKAARIIDKEYWMLGIELGLSNAQLNQMYADPACRKNTYEFVFKYLVEWRNREAEQATLLRLNRAINAARLYSNVVSKPVSF
ncbi:hypothetical protein DPMN_051473 [Dreissena polymorpha]|uniref:Uncharacterized protein n=1 Tax=Dreissena polymorpha TaxID=45954 RepID=A0A9D4CHW8_DREPO|nr:hypothetical protein DPMN_051473 [Dreissena polymorpha]